MQTLLFISFLVVFCLGDRYIRTEDKGSFSWITSTSFEPGTVPTGENDLFGAMIGRAFPDAPMVPPYFAIVHAEGKTSVDQSNNFFQGSASGLLWLFFAIGEYCEVNDRPGYQAGEDNLIQLGTYLTSTWETVATGQTEDYYWATLTETSKIFSMTCRVGTKNRMDSGISVSPYAFKCDISIDVENHWAPFTLCPENKRFIGLLSYVGSISVGINANISGNNNNDEVGVSFDDASFFKWKTTFENSETGVSYDVHSSMKDFTPAFSLPNGIASVKEIVFSFLSPKSETSKFFWDPEFGVNEDQNSSSENLQFSKIFLICVFLLLAIY